MVVLAASIISKTGKPLVSRQFVDMSRIRIEGLLAAFPKLIGTGKQHTFVETENVRYVYQPMESLYLLLVTNKQSNILEDLETLRLLSKLVPEYCPGLEEETVCRMAFELIFAFDEVLPLGLKDNVSIPLVKQYTEMESVAEKQYKADIQSKINETKDLMKRKAIEIDKTKADRFKSDKPGPSSFAQLSGSAGSLMNNGFGDLPPAVSANSFGASSAAETSKGKSGSGMPSRGMVLGKTQKTHQFLESLKAEGEVITEDLPVQSAGAPKAAAPPTDPITVSIEEKLVVVWKRDGGMENLELQGTMALTVLKEDDAYIRVQIEGGADKSFQFKTHPNIDKSLYNNNNILGLKDPSRPFPTGAPLGILKWRMQSRDESIVPLSINCWPSVSGADTYVNIEYEASSSFDLQNVVVTIPLPALRDAPTLKSYDGEPRYDGRRSVLEWTIDLIDNTNRSGSMEFVVPAVNTDVFFPIDVKFTSNKTFCDVKVLQLSATASGAPVKYTSRTQMAVESYQVV
eukprot:TRINITY_DN26268_c0_g1_i1.p1 TRINITY_DN26268_c0_g1~~TRINITY_DN26268_c0_g1_i1.p1  ORF type:complete len:515 (+),score=138.78 TRINITY_DN26268_c0_g1_i1:269-1813(+)